MNVYIKRILKVVAVIVGVIALAAISVLIYLQHPKFGGDIEEGSERALRIAKSTNQKDGYFHNFEPNPSPTRKEDAISRLVNFYDLIFVRSKTTRPKVVVPSVKTDILALDKNEELIVWLGHSTFYIQTEGKSIITDPVFGAADPLGSLNKPFESSELYSVKDIPSLDYIIITHDHWDHLEYETIKILKDRTDKFICPLGVGAHLERWGVESDDIIELDWYEDSLLDSELTITALPARHYSGRLLEKNRTLWCGYMLSSNDYNLYISGDSGYGENIGEIAKRFPNIDFAIMENGQYNMLWRHIHFVPEDLIKALGELKPKSFITSHHSKYALARHVWNDPHNTIYEASLRDSAINLLYPKIGEVLKYKEDGWSGEKWW